MSPRPYRSTPVDRARRPAGTRADRAAVEQHSRPERVAQIDRLERRGLSTREIAEQLGLARSTVNIYRADPDGERQRQRRQRYQGACADCGRPTSGSAGPARAPERCRSCAAERRRSWSEQRVLEAIRDWSELTGSPPPLADWSPAHAPREHEGAARYRSAPGRWPSASTVAARFGSLRAAIEAAGLPPAREQEKGRTSRWNLSAIADAMRVHARRTGQPPRRSDWEHADHDHPAASTVYRAAGSWRRALEAAGL
jgi:transcriptional regulator with XRE-family HTH domain